MTYDTLGILYHPTVPAARLLADDLRLALQQQAKRVWVRSAWDEGAAIDATDTDLMICIGGDGTVMRAARIVIPRQTPIIGVNMGRLGFLSEINPEEALPHLRQALAGDARVEYRTMLRAEVTLPDGTAPAELGAQHVLNDVAVGRHGGRPVYLHVDVDGVEVAVVRADGVVVSTATGSTGYNLSAGGPVLYPEARELIMTPIAAHVAHVRPLVLPPETRIDLRVDSDVRAIASFDGQVDFPLDAGAVVHVRRSEHAALFVRLGPPADFFRNLTHLLTFREDGRLA